MGILNEYYFGRLRILRSFDVEENPGSKASRMSCRVVYSNIRACLRICQIYLLLPEVEMFFFCPETLVSSRRHIS